MDADSRRQDFFQPLPHGFIEPEPRPAPRKESEMTSVLDRQQLETRVGAEGRMIVDFKRHQRIVLGDDDQRGNANSFEELI